jgi:hypothetical protein
LAMSASCVQYPTHRPDAHPDPGGDLAEGQSLLPSISLPHRVGHGPEAARSLSRAGAVVPGMLQTGCHLEERRAFTATTSRFLSAPITEPALTPFMIAGRSPLTRMSSPQRLALFPRSSTPFWPASISFSTLWRLRVEMSFKPKGHSEQAWSASGVRKSRAQPCPRAMDTSRCHLPYGVHLELSSVLTGSLMGSIPPSFDRTATIEICKR